MMTFKGTTILLLALYYGETGSLLCIVAEILTIWCETRVCVWEEKELAGQSGTATVCIKRPGSRGMQPNSVPPWACFLRTIYIGGDATDPLRWDL